MLLSSEDFLNIVTSGLPWTEAALRFKRALEIAVSMETASKDALALQDGIKTESMPYGVLNSSRSTESNLIFGNRSYG